MTKIHNCMTWTKQIPLPNLNSWAQCWSNDLESLNSTNFRIAWFWILIYTQTKNKQSQLWRLTTYGLNVYIVYQLDSNFQFIAYNHRNSTINKWKMHEGIFLALLMLHWNAFNLRIQCHPQKIQFVYLFYVYFHLLKQNSDRTFTLTFLFTYTNWIQCVYSKT